MRQTPLEGLYVLTDNQHYAHQEWAERVELAILGGAEVIQLRDKQLSDDALIPTALLLKQICADYGVIFIVNDRIKLAKQIHADGVHIGQHDLTLREARDYLGDDYLIGVSCYKHMFSALQAQKLGADYVAFGSMFTSQTKKNAPRCPLSIISQAQYLLDIPICAIGGITANNCHYALDAGADLIATTHSVFNANDPMSAANKLNHQVIMRR
ncbi:MAG: thiamine phosphate synthase [Gammaproteobacteria bacterium]|nr:thiamine phosphate synthase [Gammaproteobacteria bacterium]